VVLLGTAWGTHENLSNKLGTSLGTIGEHIENIKIQNKFLAFSGLWDKVWCCWEQRLGNAWKLGGTKWERSLGTVVNLVGTHREHGGNIKILSPPPLGSNDTYFNTCLLTPCHGFRHAEPTWVFDPHDGDTN